jgi:prefoldin subunit 5
MTLENVSVLANLQEQREQIEKQISELKSALDNLTPTHLKILGAIDVLTQIEESNNPPQDEVVSSEEDNTPESE